MSATRYRAHTQALADPEGQFVEYAEYEKLRQALIEECLHHLDRVHQCEALNARIAALTAKQKVMS